MHINSNLISNSDNQVYIIPDSIKTVIWNSLLIFCFFVCISGFNAVAQKTSEWPCFHGTDRTNKLTETNLIKEGLKDGPKSMLTSFMRMISVRNSSFYEGVN